MRREDLQELIDKAALGDASAARRLRNATGGKFENKPPEDIPPQLRAAYRAPDSDNPISLEDLRIERGYSRATVDAFVEKVCGDFIPPGAAMMLFVLLCTRSHSAFQMFGGSTRMKMMALYRFFDEAHPWVKANILYELRYRLYDEHHLRFAQGFAAKAREYDRLVAEEAAAEEQHGEHQQASVEGDSGHTSEKEGGGLRGTDRHAGDDRRDGTGDCEGAVHSGE